MPALTSLALLSVAGFVFTRAAAYLIGVAWLEAFIEANRYKS
jgi:hypothetical protein